MCPGVNLRRDYRQTISGLNGYPERECTAGQDLKEKEYGLDLPTAPEYT